MNLRKFIIQNVGQVFSDKTWIQIKFLQRMKRLPNLNNPKTYNEKLNWLKLNDRRPEYCILVDKYEMKKYVADRVGSDYIIPVVGGPWDTVDEIDFASLPDKYVLKTTHDCGGVVICKDKAKFDIERAKKILNEHMENNYFWHTREWAYKNVKPRIFAEKYVKDSASQETNIEQTAEMEQLTDYKFFCFDGEPKLMFVATDRASQTEETKFDFFDMDYNHMQIVQGHPNAPIEPQKPKSFDKMKEVAAVLSKGMPHIRVDFYEVNGQTYVGELTLFHFSGLVPFEPNEWDEKMGEWIQLPR